MPPKARCCPFHLRRLLVSLLFAVGVSWLAAAEIRKPYDIPAGPAEQSLKTFSTQSGLDVLFATKTVGKVQTNATKGEFTALEALDQVLANTGLVAAQDARTGALTVTSRPNAPRAAQTDSDRPGDSVKADSRVMQMGRFEVFGSKVINADIARSRDDVQPYVVMDRTQIEASMATNLEDFLRTRLPMNQSFSSGAQLGSASFSAINLRGLGSNQTLILVDGRRLPPRPGGLGTSVQGDVNGIPLGMIERVEILPSTASGIYGGGATGGVINIITRKDYSGTEVVMNYLNSFESDSYNRRIEVNGSYQLEGGRTMLTFNASKVDGAELNANDRNFVQRGRALQLANNPSVFFGTTPPTGYTTNIRSQNGSNLILKNGTALNSPLTHVPVGYAGVATDGGSALVANAGKYNLDLPNTLSGLQSSYLSVPDQESYGLSVRRRFGEHVEIVLDASRFENRGTRPIGTLTDATATIPTTAPNNPFTTPIVVRAAAPDFRSEAYTSLVLADRLVAGIMAKLPRDWSLGLDYMWSRSRNMSQTPQAPLGDPDGTGPGLSYSAAVANGTLDVMRDLNRYPLNYDPYRMPNPSLKTDFRLNLDEVTLRGSGPVYHLPAGNAILSASAMYRDEKIPENIRTSPSLTNPQPSYSWEPQLSLESRAYYAELLVPVFAKASPEGWTRDLELQLAARRDESTITTRSNVGSIVVPSPDGPFPSVDYVEREFSATKATLGLKYSPIRDMTLRANWGTGFLIPPLSQLGTGNPVTGAFMGVDPKRGNVSASPIVTAITGGNPNLRPEESESVSVGVILTPRFLKGLRVSVDYTRIEKTDEIAFLTNQQRLDFEDRLPGVIVRAPLTPADQALGYTGGVITQVDSRSMNVAGKRLAAYDMQVDYTLATLSWGEFQAYAIATYQPDFSSKVFVDLDYVQLVGRSDQLRWRGNGGLTWTKGPLSMGWNMQYYDSYLVYSATSSPAVVANQVLNQGSSTIPSQIYHDIQFRYQWGTMSRGWKWLLSNTQLSVGVQNVLNTSPPVVATTLVGAPGGYSYFGDPRLARYTISLRKKF